MTTRKAKTKTAPHGAVFVCYELELTVGGFEGHGLREAEDDLCARVQGLLVFVLQPPDRAYTGTDAGTDNCAYSAADHCACNRGCACGEAKGGHRALAMVIADDGAFTGDVRVANVGEVNDLGIQPIGDAVRQRYELRLQMDGGRAADAAA